MNLNLSKMKAWLGKNKKLLPIFIMMLIGIILVFASFGKSESESQGDSLDSYKASLEEEISELCSKIDGVGRCYVSISFKRGEQNSYKGSAVIETRPPEVLGVTVICKGADSDLVRGRIISMISALFDIGSNRIAVLKLK